jgi:polysaccharide biosynthesis protein PslH
LASLRLLFAVPFSPRSDAMHGGRTVAQLISRLVQRHRVALVYLRYPGRPPVDPELAGRCDLVEEIQLRDSAPTGSEWRRRLHVLSSPLTGVPSQVAPLGHRRIARACVDIATRWQPDIVQVEHDEIASCGPLLRESDSKAVRVLTSHEPGAAASDEQAQWTRGRRRIAHRLDAASWRRYWSRTLPAFDAVVALTDRDREVIEAAASGPRVVSIGLGIDLPEKSLSATGHGEPSVIFVGGYWHPPNTDAALRLLRSIMPEVRRRLPGLRLLLVGAEPGRELLDAATTDDTVTGTVSSVTPFLDRASLLVLPIRLGGGMRVKLLEALAAGKAVVASPLAAAGLEVTDGRELVLAETDSEFADSIVALMHDDDARSSLGHNAREWALHNLTWDARVTEYEQLYRSLLASRAP